MFNPHRSIRRWAPWLGMLLPASGSALTQAASSVFLSCTDGQLPDDSINESGPIPLALSCEESIDFGSSGSRSSSAGAATTFGASRAASCQSDVSFGSISFDQAAFDALMGGSSFPLADHYAFDVSANLIPPLPGPGSGARAVLVLAITALAIVAAAGTLRARST